MQTDSSVGTSTILAWAAAALSVLVGALFGLSSWTVKNTLGELHRRLEEKDAQILALQAEVVDLRIAHATNAERGKAIDDRLTALALDLAQIRAEQTIQGRLSADTNAKVDQLLNSLANRHA